MTKQPPLCVTGRCEMGTRHWPKEKCLLPVNVTVTENVTPRDGKRNTVTPHVTDVMSLVTPSVTPGQPCPTCGRRVPMSHAQRQATYRDRTTPRGVSQEQGGGTWPEKYFRAPRPGGPGTL